MSNLQQRSQSLRVREVAHAREGARCDKYGRGIGLIVVMLTTFIGTTAFTQINDSTSNTLKVIAGAAAVLAAYKENASYGKLAAQHGDAAAKFGQLHHEVEEILLKYERKGESYGDSLTADLEKVNKAEAELAGKAATLGPRALAGGEEWVKLHSGGQ